MMHDVSRLNNLSWFSPIIADKNIYWNIVLCSKLHGNGFFNNF